MFHYDADTTSTGVIRLIAVRGTVALQDSMLEVVVASPPHMHNISGEEMNDGCGVDRIILAFLRSRHVRRVLVTHLPR